MKKANSVDLSGIFTLIGLVVLFSCVLILSCDQDPIFYNISYEKAPKDPRVAGSPTNMVVIDKTLYVGTYLGGAIWTYNTGVWRTISEAGGSTGGLAAAGDCLYALVRPGDPASSGIVKKYDPVSGEWDPDIKLTAPNGYVIQSIYGAGDLIFAGAMKEKDCIILFHDPAWETLLAPIDFVEIIQETSLLTGAVATGPAEFYLSTSGNGIYLFDGINDNDEPIEGTKEKNVRGIIATGIANEYISAVTSSGEILTLDGPIFSSLTTIGKNCTGAMCVWREYDPAYVDPDPAYNKWKPSLLLLGIQDTGTNTAHGYRELTLESDGKPADSYQIPGSSVPSSVLSESMYHTSIGNHPVMSILQLPNGIVTYPDMTENEDWQPPIFASTQRNGLWSYDPEEDQWNAEE